MRNITIRSTTSDNKRRRHLRMTEFISDDGLMAKAEKKYAFYISEKKNKVAVENLKTWINDQNEVHRSKCRHVSVRRTFDKDTGLGHTMYRTTGSFYVVKQLKIYVVVFLHTVRFDILNPGSFQS